MARDDPTIYLRIPAELKQRLELAAAENRRSITAELVARLETTFRPVDRRTVKLSRSELAAELEAVLERYIENGGLLPEIAQEGEKK